MPVVTRSPVPPDDGSDLLTSPAVADLLRAAVSHGGGTLVSWRLDHVDADPQRSTTATFRAVIDWPFGRRDELLGASARVGGPSVSDERAVIFADGRREVAVWLYPHDPDLPALDRAAYAEQLARTFSDAGTFGAPVSPDQLELTMVGYRPRRRAVLRARVQLPSGPLTCFVKVLRPNAYQPVLLRHQMLAGAGLPSPQVLLALPEGLLVTRELAGRPLARAIFDAAAPCRAEDLIALLDAMPAEVATLERRQPWTDAVGQYAGMVATALPEAAPQLERLTEAITSGVAGIPPGDEPTHGDFYEAQVFVGGGRVTGMLDVDTVGPGRRADDLACLIAHLTTVQRMNPEQEARVRQLVTEWLPVFDTRVDPVELRLRAAAVAISLATGPYRGQERDWPGETRMILDAAERLVRSVR
ncbi:hypothetical protein FHX74_000859 [Friedmanniella endophytica]|uniref:Aminoglycoside phosphotransferase domain-containing protein n=1 Tax=Microlunatus kandeliicorticis TaxID=1759536 RepID=A0A7W3IQD0_9ACTN|nr:phosphotransferase [Microlunatus kandeliicorticis]MBA8793265.1 hypothetical protein [Microlunatus kandeliicorticis]